MMHFAWDATLCNLSAKQIKNCMMTIIVYNFIDWEGEEEEEENCLRIWQISPVHPGAQLQEKLSMTSKQVPPLRQGLLAHSFISGIDMKINTFLYRFILAIIFILTFIYIIIPISVLSMSIYLRHITMKSKLKLKWRVNVFTKFEVRYCNWVNNIKS